MTNNQLCDLIGSCGCVISSLCFFLCFFGITAWIGLGIGVVLMVVSQVSYN